MSPSGFCRHLEQLRTLLLDLSPNLNRLKNIFIFFYISNHTAVGALRDAPVLLQQSELKVGYEDQDMSYNAFPRLKI
jgi:hypothetical protein